MSPAAGVALSAPFIAIAALFIIYPFVRLVFTAVGDPPTDLSLHPHSPGYRLILNNVLFPAAKKKELKT